jgi:hypothetical protein
VLHLQSGVPGFVTPVCRLKGLRVLGLRSVAWRDRHGPARVIHGGQLAPALHRRLEDLDVLAQQRIDERGEIDALGVGDLGEAVLQVRLQIHRQVQRPVELTARTTGEVDLGGYLLIG